MRMTSPMTPLVLLVLLGCHVPLVNARFYPKDGIEVFSGEHFLNLVDTPMTPGVALRSTVLVLYGPLCANFDLRGWMIDSHFYIFAHNYIEAEGFTWYKWRDQDNLFKKYAEPDAPCLSAYFFKKGSSLDTPTEVWPGSGSLKDWVLSLLKRKVTVTNKSGKVIRFLEETAKNAYEFEVIQRIRLDDQEKITMSVFASNMVKLMSDNYDTTYKAFIVTTDMNTDIVLEDADGRADAVEVWRIEKEENERLANLKWSHLWRIMKTLKQPLFVFNYTEVGYKKTVIPPALYKELKEFYDKHTEQEHSKHVEEMYKFNTTDALLYITDEHKAPLLVDLPKHLSQKVAETIQPICEEYCNCTMRKDNIIFGIREYFEGSVLNFHTDRTRTHVIGAILQIDQDLAGQEDWLLEVVRYDGTRRTLTLHPGEMLLYESGKLIHGRPKAFRGKIMANMFAHFSPVDWPYHLNVDTMVMYDKQRRIQERVNEFPSALTEGRVPPAIRPDAQIRRDEL